MVRHRRPVVAGMAAVVLAGGATLTGGTAGAATPVAMTPTARPVPRMTVKVVDPWRDGSTRRAIAAKSVTRVTGSCSDSTISGRRDAYRCFLGNLLFDPCFVNPRSSRQIACPGGSRTGWLVATNVRTRRSEAGSSPTKGWIFQVRLVNGAMCYRGTGAFPPGPRGWEAGAGACRGGPFKNEDVLWRVGGRSTESPAFYPLVSRGSGRWAAAVERDEGRVTLFPVRTAWR
ncbi:hypothetical protein [Mobilicoccus sp.]|uniref:hypothetical protein n=1 Tax=Mobilicoccus sp. TaxID=2034349 RepID=UPI0028B1358F|nr:hypothetical protein [Mobilicoccus sp.]